jgi:hypothetical protein
LLVVIRLFSFISSPNLFKNRDKEREKKKSPLCMNDQ